MKRPEPYQDRAYRQWISGLPCCICHPEVIHDPWRFHDPARRMDPDHLPCDLKGVSMKSPDQFVIPLCRRHHQLRPRQYRRPHALWRVRLDSGVVVDFNPWYFACRLRWAYERCRKESDTQAI